MVNELVAKRLLANLQGLVRDLEEAGRTTLAEFRRDVRTQRYVERTLHIAIEAVLDLAHHIISDERLREPNSYADAFVVLAENHIISQTLAAQGERMAKFRNLLVHYYERLDPDQTYAVLQAGPADLHEFARQINQWMIR